MVLVRLILFLLSLFCNNTFHLFSSAHIICLVHLILECFVCRSTNRFFIHSLSRSHTLLSVSERAWLCSATFHFFYIIIIAIIIVVVACLIILFACLLVCVYMWDGSTPFRLPSHSLISAYLFFTLWPIIFLSVYLGACKYYLMFSTYFNVLFI